VVMQVKKPFTRDLGGEFIVFGGVDRRRVEICGRWTR